MVSEVPGLLHRLLDAVPGAGRTLVAIDGVGASGKTTLAGQLADAISARPVVVLHADDFFHPRSFRHGRGRYSPEGFWQDTYDLDRLVSMALVPLGPGGDGRYRAASYDPVSDRTVRPEPCAPWERASVVIDTTDLSRPRIIDRASASAARGARHSP